ncbi:MAG: hypothetical protein BroJett026_37140 [Betaproteobacteria bacterium]|nr:MAG: hypothetical protein BroJett026_37140 [Betaproteobacteria bacterium]
MSVVAADRAALVARTATSAVCDALVKRGLRHQFMKQRVRQLGALRVAGPALTIERVPLPLVPAESRMPNSAMLEAIHGAAPGTVLVFNDPHDEAALFGGLMAAAAVQRSLGGIVADGPVRDPAEIIEVGCPCFCTGSVAAGQAGILALKSIGEALECGGVRVSPGDFLLGDTSGVVVIPQAVVDEVLNAAVEIEDGDQAALRSIREGRDFLEAMRALGRA